MCKDLRGWYELNGKRTILNVLLLLTVIGFIDPIKQLLEALPINLLQINHSWQVN